MRTVPLKVHTQTQTVPLKVGVRTIKIVNTDYDVLENKPRINGVELVGNKTFEDLGEETISNAELQSIIEAQYNLIFGGGANA